MDDTALEEQILLALRRSPGMRSAELAHAVGLPRTNFGRQLKNRLEHPLERLVADRSIERDGNGYRLTERGRKRLKQRSNGKP